MDLTSNFSIGLIFFYFFIKIPLKKRFRTDSMSKKNDFDSWIGYL